MKTIRNLGRRLGTAVNQTNIGYCRLAFNVGAGDQLPLRARLFDTPTGHAFKASLPYAIPSLQAYGEEVYGAWNVTLPSTKPQPMIPPGGLAYSAQGNYICVFFGQAPAWPVDYFAQIEVGWEALRGGRWTDLHASLEDPLAMESY